MNILCPFVSPGGLLPHKPSRVANPPPRTVAHLAGGPPGPRHGDAIPTGGSDPRGSFPSTSGSAFSRHRLVPEILFSLGAARGSRRFRLINRAKRN
ncbi:hypothetical protein NL676_015498 [Syzygium grande]|nr:hypothetical protein NL676_015498 [Syzygium grande]